MGSHRQADTHSLHYHFPGCSCTIGIFFLKVYLLLSILSEVNSTEVYLGVRLSLFYARLLVSGVFVAELQRPLHKFVTSPAGNQTTALPVAAI